MKNYKSLKMMYLIESQCRKRCECMKIQKNLEKYMSTVDVEIGNVEITNRAIASMYADNISEDNRNGETNNDP